MHAVHALGVAVPLGLGLLLGGCGGGGGGGGGGATAAPVTSTAPTSTATSGGSGGSPSLPHPLLPAGREAEEGRFMTSTACASCHSTSPSAAALKDAAGRAVGPYDLWQASLMANAARDPLFRAEVSVEAAATPSLKVAIEAKCLSCHSPMATWNHTAAGSGTSLTLASLSRDDVRGQLALDGVSCSFCHAAAPVTDPTATFNGNPQLSATRDMFGPHQNPYGTPMALRTAFQPVEGQHVMRSALCASCHTLTTSAHAPDGTPTGGSILEQSPYLEWRNSVFTDEVPSPGPEARTCQGCHVPTDDQDGAPIRTRLARENGGRDFPQLQERDPFGRHLFLGGNTLALQLLRDNAAELRPLAPTAAFDQAIALTRRQLRDSTARVSIAAPTRAGALLRVAVQVENLTGHKLPTGHPSRRMWLRLRVRDAQGGLVFASGEHDAEGRLIDMGGAVLPAEQAGGAPLPHQDRVSDPARVQVWEAVMRDGAGDPTYLLLRGEGWWKDDRLLPRGWSATGPHAAATAAVGIGSDASFSGGADTVTYELQAPAAGGPYTIEATLLYQPYSPRFAAELFRWKTPEVDALRDYWQAADKTPELLAEATLAGVP